jgi:hypothetical protein
MKDCPQTDNQSVYEHGVSVYEHMLELIEYLRTGEIGSNWKLPDWVAHYRQELLDSLLPIDIIEEYAIHHDCGKTNCLQIDEQGKRHFPNHAQASHDLWLSLGGNQEAAKLMLLDMQIHTIKAVDVSAFCEYKGATTLLLAGLSEIHANAEVCFGGFDSTSFKIKYKQLDRRGRAVCECLFVGAK